MARRAPQEHGFTINHLSAVVIGGAALSLFLYLNSEGRLGHTGGDDEALAEALEEHAPESQAAAWGNWRPSPVGVIDDEATEESFFVEAPEVVELAWGWSHARAEPIPTVCIDYGVDRRTAQTSDIEITEVRDSYALAKALNVSSSVSVKGVGYQVSGKASFARNTNVSSSSVTFLVNAEVLNGAEYVRPPEEGPGGIVGAVRLTEAAAALALRDIERFQAVCGEGFVSATISGARAYLLAETETASRSERQAVRASVKGSGWGATASAAAGHTSTAETQSLNRNLTFYQQGGAAIPDAPAGATGLAEAVAAQASLPKDAGEAIERITQLPVAAASAGKIFELQITPYQVLENFPRGEDLLAADDEHEEIAADWGAYQTLYADLKAVLETPAAYLGPIRRRAGEGVGATCVLQMTPLVEGLVLNMEAMAVVEGLQDMTLRAMNEIEIAAETCMIVEEHCQYDGDLVRSPYSVRAGMPLLRDVAPTVAAFAGTVAEVSLYGDLLTRVVSAKIAEDAARVAEAEAAGDDTALAAARTALARATEARTALEETLAREVAETLPDGEDHLIQHLREPALGRCVFGAGTSGCISNAEIRGWAARTGLATIVTADKAVTRARLETDCGVDAAHIVPGDADDASAPTPWFPAAALACVTAPQTEISAN